MNLTMLQYLELDKTIFQLSVSSKMPPRVPKIKIQEKSQISFCQILKNKWNHTKVLLKRFHLNGHTMGFHPQTQKLEQHCMSPLLTLGGPLGGKGLNLRSKKERSSG